MRSNVNHCIRHLNYDPNLNNKYLYLNLSQKIFENIGIVENVVNRNVYFLISGLRHPSIIRKSRIDRSNFFKVKNKFIKDII